VVHKKSGGASASARTSKVKKIKDGDLDDVKVCHSFVYIFFSILETPPIPLNRAGLFLYILCCHVFAKLFVHLIMG
jgi:hypothetical protein